MSSRSFGYPSGSTAFVLPGIVCLGVAFFVGVVPSQDETLVHIAQAFFLVAAVMMFFCAVVSWKLPKRYPEPGRYDVEVQRNGRIEVASPTGQQQLHR